MAGPVRWPTLVQNLLEGAYLNNTPNKRGLLKKDAGLKRLNRWLNFLYSVVLVLRDNMSNTVNISNLMQWRLISNIIVMYVLSMSKHRIIVSFNLTPATL